MWWFTLLLGCGPDDAEGCAPALPAGGLSADVAGAPFDADDATWRLAGAAIQLNASGADGSSMSVVLQTTTDGADAGDAAAPFSVDLGDAGGGFATYYPASGDSLTTGAAGGSGTFEVVTFGDTVAACFSGVFVGSATLDVTGEVVAAGAE